MTNGSAIVQEIVIEGTREDWPGGASKANGASPRPRTQPADLLVRRPDRPGR